MRYYNNFIINTKFLTNNLIYINKKLKGKKLLFVVKANCYGFGYNNIINAVKNYVDYFGVSCLHEALEIRKYDTSTEILVLGVVNLEDIQTCIDNNIAVTISSYNQLLAYMKEASFECFKIHFKINSGMNRYGINNIKEFKKCLDLCENNSYILFSGIYTHFATKQKDVDFINYQYNIFSKFVKLSYKFNPIVHCMNSFAFFNFSKIFGNMVRLGISVYGENNYTDKLKRVFSVTSEIVFIHKILKNESVSYDRNFIAKTNMKIGVVPIGYADGFKKILSNNFYVLINGEYCKVVGNVCMDCFMVDITNIKNVFVGSQVVLLGKGGTNEITLLDYAKKYSESIYEVMLSFNHLRMNVLLCE